MLTPKPFVFRSLLSLSNAPTPPPVPSCGHVLTSPSDKPLWIRVVCLWQALRIFEKCTQSESLSDANVLLLHQNIGKSYMALKKYHEAEKYFVAIRKTMERHGASPEDLGNVSVRKACPPHECLTLLKCPPHDVVPMSTAVVV